MDTGVVPSPGLLLESHGIRGRPVEGWAVLDPVLQVSSLSCLNPGLEDPATVL